MIVDIVKTCQSLCKERIQLFEDLYFKNVLQIHKEEEFYRFFEENWKKRNYSTISCQRCDKII